jgi:UDP-glucose 4-epimerase
VLVTGPTGFIGVRLVERLLRANYEVCAVVRLPGGLEERRGLTVVEWDLVHGAPPPGVPPRADAVVHLAARIPAPHRGEEGDFFENLTMTTHLLSHLVGPRHVVFGSTIDVYGRPRSMPLGEDHPTEPLTSYGVSKLLCERHLQEASAARGFVVTVLRFAQVYGPGDRSGKAIPRFIGALLDGQSPVVYDDGSDLSDYVHVDDVAKAVVLALQRRSPGVFNISAGHAHSIAEVLHVLMGIHGAGVRPVYEPRRGEKFDFCLDISRARTNLGYAPEIPLHIGLRQQYEWTRALRSGGPNGPTRA